VFDQGDEHLVLPPFFDAPLIRANRRAFPRKGKAQVRSNARCACNRFNPEQEHFYVAFYDGVQVKSKLSQQTVRKPPPNAMAMTNKG
jgi:hypothetical protein